MTMTSPTARYLEGTAFIVYGPGPGSGPEPSAPPSHHPHHHHTHSHTHSHLHSHAGHEAEEQPAFFWAVFRPSTTAVLPKPSPTQQHPSAQTNSSSSSNDVLFFLQGTPHLWGSYPPDMEQPHGCLPPHLYYRVTISEHTTSDPINNWVLPFVHRIGDGSDHAGGLTTAYNLLRDQEDAEDLGDFIHDRIRQLQAEHNHDLEFATTFDDATSGITANSGTAAAQDPILASLYACTEVLISERRTFDVIQQQFFSSMAFLNPGLKEFQHHLRKTIDAVDPLSQPLPFSLVQSDLKLILPLHATQLHSIRLYK
ncbi:hypothetical protein BKA57DRAFT_507169 [Linnemannia elongata]|nr:hypothetical protein BKA57DRAFT_507169 [Linnemannia elongata]